MNAIVKIDPVQADMTSLIYGVKDMFQSRLIGNDINFESEAGFAVQTLMANSYALNIARLNRQSVIDAVTNVAAIGVSLNPAKKQAYLVPRKNAICLDISYMGLIDLAVATGSVLWAQCVIVYENDVFQLQGVDKQPIHTRDPFSKDKGAIQGAYACIKTPQGDFLTHAMPISEIYAIRDRSELYKASKSGPWKTDEGEMIKKTVIKQAYKYWPKTSPQLEQAIHHLNNDGVESIDFKAEQQEEPQKKKRLPKLSDEEAEQAYKEWMEVKSICVDEDGNNDNDKVTTEWFKRASNVRTAITAYGNAIRASEQLDSDSKSHLQSIRQE